MKWNSVYFWNIRKLKAQLIERPMTQRESLNYLVPTLALYSLIYFPIDTDAVTYVTEDYVYFFLEIVTLVASTVWIYHKNHGSNGKNFLERYLAISWVARLRFAVFFIISILLLTLLGLFLGFDKSIDKLVESTFFMWILCIMFEIVVSLYVGKHIAEVAERSSY